VFYIVWLVRFLAGEMKVVLAVDKYLHGMGMEPKAMKSIYRFWTSRVFDGYVRWAANLGEFAGIKYHGAAIILQLCFVAILCIGLSTAAGAKEGFVTATFGSAIDMHYPGTLNI
jgi:hypothetical protein